MFVSLKRLGKEVEMVRFPGCTHSFLRSGHPKMRVEYLRRMKAWFDTHLGPLVTPKEEEMRLRNAVRDVKRYATQLVNFWISLVGVASISTVIWYFDPTRELSFKIIVTLLAVAIPLAPLMDGLSKDKESHKFSWKYTWFPAFSIFALIVVFLGSIDAPNLDDKLWPFVGSSGSLDVADSWEIAQAERILKLWLAPIVLLALLYLAPSITPEGEILDLFLVPLPVVSCACVAWGLVTKWSLTRARCMQGRTIWGPGIQSLSMLLLVGPFIVLTMLAVNALGFDDVWVAVSGAIVGILFGGAVSEPFRKFMLDLGKLSGNARM